jgi:hypothetical protein
MSDEAKHLNIRWRRIYFGSHLFLIVLVRLLIGSLHQMPPPEIYNMFEAWGAIIMLHAVLLAIAEGRDRAEPPLKQINRLIVPRERRWSLLAIDAMVWIILTVAIANRVIPERVIFQYVVPLSLLWLALTAGGLAHILLVLYAEVRDRAPSRKRKVNAQFRHGETPLLTSDGELLETIEESSDPAAVKRTRRS